MFVLVCNHSKAKRGQKLNYPNGGVDIFYQGCLGWLQAARFFKIFSI